MKISYLIQKWSGIRKKSKIVIITDDIQRETADFIRREGIYDVQVGTFPMTEEFVHLLKSLSSSDLVIVLLSYDSFVKFGGNKYFSPFSKPDWISAKYIFVRLEISKESLVQGLSTEKKLVYDKIEEMNCINTDEIVRVTNASGTDISFKIKPFTTCLHEITENGGMAFLPPSETSAEVLADTANGKIVIDVTAGQLYHYGELVGYFGLVIEPVTMNIENGYIVDIYGDSMALEIKEKVFSLPVECRRIVELGQGLSKMKPTGLIGVDESIIDSCHFGFGDGGTCGTHWDVVIANPTYEVKRCLK